MKRKKNPSTESVRYFKGPFLQPLALAVVCVVFVVLLLTLGVMDFRTLDKTLISFMEKRGTDFIKTVWQRTDMNLAPMNAIPQWGFEGSDSADLDDQGPSLQESMVMALLRLAQGLDDVLNAGKLTRDELAPLIFSNGLWNLALFNERGEITFERRPVSGIVAHSVKIMTRDRRDLKIHLFGGFRKPGAPRFLALRRKDGNGFLVLVLDQGAFLFWRLKTALEMAVDTVGMPSNTECFTVVDSAGMTLFQGGVCPETSVPDEPTSGVLRKLMGIISGKPSRGNSRLLVVRKIALGEAGPLTARLRLDAESLQRTIAREKRWGMIAMGFMMFIAVLSMWFLYRNQNRHIARLRQLEGRVQRAERLSAMGRLASGVAHEIRNPLNAISMACQRLKADNLERLSPVIRKEIERLNGIVEEFLGLSKGQRLNLKAHDLVELVRHVALLMGEEARSKGIQIRTPGTTDPLIMWVDAGKLEQALINMVKNAFDALLGQGTVTMGISKKDASTAMLTVSDTGTGLSERDIDRIFNLDFTTKEKGLGLGLALAHEIIQAHGGEIRVKSTPGAGTSFFVLLPLKLKNGTK